MKRTFERKYISYLSLFAAIFIKTLLYLHFFQLEGDKLFQALGAKNLVEGHGLTFQHISATDLSTQIVEQVNRWPFGYSLILAPLYWLTANMEASCIIIDICAICFFFFTLFKLLQLLELGPFLISLVILINGMIVGEYISKPTDLIACGGLLYACYLFMVFLSDRSRPGKYGIAIGAASVIPVFFRYMYLPCIWIIPAMLLWVGYRKKDNRITSAGGFALTACILLTVTLLLAQKSIVGSTSYIMSSEKGFFPENLLRMYPFIVDGFFDINFVQQQLSIITGMPYLFFFECLKYVNLVLLVILLYKFMALVARKYSIVLTRWDHFVILTGLINVALLLLLGYLSVTNSSTSGMPSGFRWTFIGDGRYFIFPAVVITIITGHWLFNTSWMANRIYQRLLQLLILLIVFLQLVHISWFIGRRFEPLALKGGNVLITRSAQSLIKNRIKQVKDDGWAVALTGNDETVANWATLNGEKGILDLDELLSANVRPQQPTVVFVLIGSKTVPFVENRLIEKKFILEKEIDKLYIFSKKYVSQ